MNRDAIKEKGKNAMGKFLKHLQVYKSSADVKKGTDFLNRYLEVYNCNYHRWMNCLKNTKELSKRTRGQEEWVSNLTPLYNKVKPHRAIKNMKLQVMDVLTLLSLTTDRIAKISWNNGKSTTKSSNTEPKWFYVFNR